MPKGHIAEYDMVISQIFGSEEEGYKYYNPIIMHMLNQRVLVLERKN